MRYTTHAHAMLCARMYAHNTECAQTAVPYYGRTVLRTIFNMDGLVLIQLFVLALRFLAV